MEVMFPVESLSEVEECVIPRLRLVAGVSALRSWNSSLASASCGRLAAPRNGAALRSGQGHQLMKHHLSSTLRYFQTAAAVTLLWTACQPCPAAPVSVSGVYPHLAFFNNEGECGTGAVVPWADRLWVITYAPHMPKGSSDKLYQIDGALNLTVRPESIGGTPANRMIHRESQQLFIGPYVIDAERNVRVIPYSRMFGRLTGNARHLGDPANKIYFATMEEGLYEVDVHSLEVNRLWTDEQEKDGRHADLPGYHGKGLYSGQGRIVYANNGEHGPKALVDPSIPSGVLAEWNGRSDAWTVVRRNQFTEVTGPGGIEGNPYGSRDPVWSIGWDHRSLILMCLDKGRWQSWRLPKASHCYDGAHGWNTEWPRIREIGGGDLLMTMHGMFWRFPATFCHTNSAGIAPRSTYLKVIGDFARWQGKVVFGCDDTAKNEFLNKRKAKGDIAGPGQSHSNLWFVEPGQLDEFGPALGRGAVWFDEPVKAGEPSDAFLFSGFERRGAHLTHEASTPVTFRFEVDRHGDGRWRALREVTVPANGYTYVEFKSSEYGAWVRVTASVDCPKATVFFNMSNRDRRSTESHVKFDGVATTPELQVTGGIVRVRGENMRTLHYAAVKPGGNGPQDIGYYEMGADLKLKPVEDSKAHAWLKEKVAIPGEVLKVDEASVLVIDDKGRRWRLPRGSGALDAPGVLGDGRVDREVCTERDLFNAHGTFYELPAENAGGFAKMRPITTHNRRIKDYCSYRGLLVMSGVSDAAPGKSPHIVKSTDGKTALWVGVVDDLWQLGKARGMGGPWKNSPARAGEPSDPYLMSGYDQKQMALQHGAKGDVTIRIEVDLTGTGLWRTYQQFKVPAGRTVKHTFPKGFQAYWVRAVADRDCQATVELVYE